MSSRRAKRMQKQHKKGKVVGLNLVSLMDIFTILVFFLLVNSSDIETLPNPRDLQLPESIAEEKSRENVVVVVTHEHILVQGKVVASTEEVLQQDELIISNLENELRLQTEKRLIKEPEDAALENREVTIMGDKGLPYTLMKRVMASCTEAHYGRMSLAIMQKAPAEQSMVGVADL